jgi:ABC-type polysaccharide/polyol phosphate transport system ATPase subunit
MEEIIEFSELGDFIDLPFKSYSQGMAARLAFSVATTLEPGILLMDEWIGAGDSAFQDKAKKRMAELTEKAGIIVLASHNYALLKNTCNKVLELRQGQVKALQLGEDFFTA